MARQHEFLNLEMQIQMARQHEFLHLEMPIAASATNPSSQALMHTVFNGSNSSMKSLEQNADCEVLNDAPKKTSEESTSSLKTALSTFSIQHFSVADFSLQANGSRAPRRFWRSSWAVVTKKLIIANARKTVDKMDL